MRVCPSHPNDERGHLSHWSQTPSAKTPIQTARNSGSPAQPPRAAVRHASVVKHAREKQSEHKMAACSQHAQALPVGQELDIGPFPLLRHSMRPSVIKRAPCIERARKKLNKRKSAACSQRARGRASHGQSPLGSTRAYFPELAPLGLDSGTRGYNPRCRDTVALPPPSSLECIISSQWFSTCFGIPKR